MVLGECGHNWASLGLAISRFWAQVDFHDTSAAAVESVLSGSFPQGEAGAEEVLKRNLASGDLTATSQPNLVQSA
jgi:UDP-glucose 6-dehydrogenase